MISRRQLLRKLAGGAALASLPGTLGAANGPGAAAGRERHEPWTSRGRAPQQGEILIRGGEVLSPAGRRPLDVRCAGGRIVELASGLEPGAGTARVLDARGLLVLPGGVDPHTHLSPPWVDDFTSGSRAALAGGITTVGHIAYPAEGESLLDVVGREEARIGREAVADVILHPVVLDPTGEVLEQLPALVRAGHTTVKVYMVLPGFDESVSEHLALLEACAAAGVLVMVHCEDAPLIRKAVEQLEARGEDDLSRFPESRPVISEVVATQRAVAMAEATGAALYVVHLSAGRALDVTSRARDRGLDVFVETRPLYLHFTEEVYRGPDGPLWVGMPPIRKAEDRKALWDGLARGKIDVVATDHAPWTREQKLDPDRTVANPRAGVNNLQVMLPVLFSEGVRGGRITLERFVEVTSAAPARLMGLHPRKGTVSVGADADLVLWEAERSRTIRREDVLSAAGFSVFEGRDVTGWPVLTLRRGEVVWEHGRSQGRPGSGLLLPRRPWSDPGAPQSGSGV